MNRRPSFPPPHARLASSFSLEGRRPRRELAEKHVEALTVAMIVAPGVYARNRMFELFQSAGARRARTRAGIVRGIVPQLARATAVTVSGESRAGDTTYVLRYMVPAVRLTRVVELSAAELAALRLVAERSNIRTLPAGGGDKDLVARALAKLMDADASSFEVSRLVHEISAPSSE